MRQISLRSTVTTIATTLAAVSAMSVATANAEDVSPFAAMKAVNFTASELQTTEGINNVHRRLVSAAESVCGLNRSFHEGLGIERAKRTCVTQTLDAYFAATPIKALSSYNMALSPRARYNSKHAAVANWGATPQVTAQLETFTRQQ